MSQIQFNKGIIGLTDNLTEIIKEKPYYLRIKITNLVFKDGFENATKIVIDIEDKEKIIVEKYKELNKSDSFRTITINEEYEFVTSEFKLKIDKNISGKFDFTLNYENING
jgi:hypothetical protein